MYQFISIGGWCGTRLALDQLQITNEPHNIFDFIRSSSKGIIDCIKYDFANYIPENKNKDTRFSYYRPYTGEHISLYYTDNLTDENELNSINRKINRFHEYCKSDKYIFFVRTCSIPDYEEEIKDMKELYLELSHKYPLLKFKIIFIIPDQDITTYYKNIDNNIFIFTLNDKTYNNNNLGSEYKGIYDFIFENNLFEIIPKENDDIKIVKPTTRLCLLDNIPVVNYFNKYIY